jgi:hypothetical protein
MSGRRYGAAMELWELEARESVRDTIASYTFAGDRRRLRDMAACFTEQGSMEINGAEPLVGRDVIAATLEQVLPSERTPTHAHHHVSSIHFASVTPTAVETSSYFKVLTDCGLDHWGRYRDRFVPAEGRWLLESRRITVDGRSAESYFSGD